GPCRLPQSRCRSLDRGSEGRRGVDHTAPPETAEQAPRHPNRGAFLCVNILTPVVTLFARVDPSRSNGSFPRKALRCLHFRTHARRCSPPRPIPLFGSFPYRVHPSQSLVPSGTAGRLHRAWRCKVNRSSDRLGPIPSTTSERRLCGLTDPRSG